MTSTENGLGERFWKLWTAATGSALGTGMAAVAAPLLVATYSSDPLVVSSAMAANALPWLLFTLPAGALVDRLDRRRVMVAMDWLRMAAVTVLGVALVTGWGGLALIYPVLFVLGLGEVLFRSASHAILPSLVDRARLERANGWLVGGQTLTSGLVAAPLGALLFGVHEAAPFLGNAGTYLLSAVLLMLIHGRYRGTEPTVATAGPRARGAFRAEIVEGVRWLVGQRLVRTLAVLIGLLNVTLTAALSILVLVVHQRLHGDGFAYGALFTCMALGGILGSVLGDRLIRTVTATWTLRIGLLLEAVLHLVLATSHSVVVVGAAFLVFGVHGSLWSIVTLSIRQRLTPPALQGRVTSVYLFVAAGGNALGAILGGALAGRFGLPAPYWLGFVAAVLVSATTWRVFDRATIAAAYADPVDPTDQVDRTATATATATADVPGTGTGRDQVGRGCPGSWVGRRRPGRLRARTCSPARAR